MCETKNLTRNRALMLHDINTIVLPTLFYPFYTGPLHDILDTNILGLYVYLYIYIYIHLDILDTNDIYIYIYTYRHTGY